jgi:hypothetical protein
MYPQLCNRDGMSSQTTPQERAAVLAVASALGVGVVSKTFKDGAYTSRFKDNGGIVFKDTSSETRFKGCTDDEINRDCTLAEMLTKLANTYAANNQ